MACKTHVYVKHEDEMKYARRVTLRVMGQDFNNRHFVNVAIINLSECPINNIYVIGCSYDKDEAGKKSYGVYGQCDVILPNANELNKVYMTVEVLGILKDLSSVTATMFFRDANGIEWCRDSRDGLYKCPGYIEFFKNCLD